MNIALFPSAFHPHFGGVEELVRQLAHELRRRGHNVIILTNRWPHSLAATEIHEGIPVYRIPFRVPASGLRAKAGYYLTTWRSRAEMLRILRKHNVDVLHVQCVSSNAHYAIIAKKCLGLPLVVTLQGELTMDAGRIFQTSRIAQGLLRRAIESADLVTGCSARTLADAQAFLGCPIAAPSRAIFNGASVDDFANAKPIVHDRPYVFAIGRLVAQKGFDELLYAFARSEVQSHDLLIAGDGPERGALEQLAKSLNLTRSVRFLGKKDRSEVPALFKGADLFVLPSRAQEGMPVVCAEAMAAGKPVIANRVGGVPEIITDGENGLVLEPGDIAGWSNAIRLLCSDVALQERLSSAGRTRAQKFDWKQIAADYAAGYEDVCSARSRAHVGVA